MRLPRLTAKTAPIWLPVAFLIRDFLAWQYVFSYEPGITEKAVRIHHFLLVPGVFYGVNWSTPVNLLFGLLLGLAIRLAASKGFPYSFAILVLAWNFVIAGFFGFLAETSPAARSLFRIGMLPGRLLSHGLYATKMVLNDSLLFTLMILGNLGTALLLTVGVCRLRDRFRTA
jgi:hypothetical protein